MTLQQATKKAQATQDPVLAKKILAHLARTAENDDALKMCKQASDLLDKARMAMIKAGNKAGAKKIETVQSQVDALCDVGSKNSPF